jgi:signal transduction histidine kinase
VPLVVRDNIIGAIAFGMDQSNREFSSEDIATAETLASRAALVIDNARLYRDLQEAVSVRDVFLLIASHELKTPLTSVLGQAQLLQQRLTQAGILTERDTRAMQVIVEQSLRLNKLISNLLDVSRLSQGQLQLNRELVNLNELVQRIVADFGPMLDEQRILYHDAQHALIVDGDPLRLEQVIQNLLQNALKYSPQQGTVHVTLEVRGYHAQMTVSDSGIGIPAEAIPKLFQRFYRVNNSATRHMSGIGLGLYVVHEIVTLHGGEVFVVSAEGQGSSFMITLPLVPTE